MTSGICGSDPTSDSSQLLKLLREGSQRKWITQALSLSHRAMIRYKRMTGESSGFQGSKEEEVPERSRTAEEQETLSGGTV